MSLYLLLPVFFLIELYTDLRLLRITQMLFWRYPEIYKSIGFRDGENAFVRSLKMNYRLVYSRKTRDLPLGVRVELVFFALWRPMAILYFFVLLRDKTAS